MQMICLLFKSVVSGPFNVELQFHFGNKDQIFVTGGAASCCLIEMDDRGGGGREGGVGEEGVVVWC